MLGAVLPHSLPSHRRLVAALAWIVALTLAGLVTPARGLASDTSWIPSSSSLVKTARTCPSPTVAVYYNSTCWTVAPDRSSPFYRPDGPYAWGQCTYWALEMRPDLWNNRSAVDPDPGNWTAYTWPQHALLEGLTVDHAPVAGAVIVWPQSDDTDSGHVAFVQSVGVNSVTGAVLVTLQEMNDTTFDDPAQGQGDTMTMSMTASDLAQVQIIHAPGNTTGTVPTTPAPSVPTNPVSPTHSTPARTSTSPAPTSTSPAPTSTSPAPTSMSPAPTGAPVRTPPAPTSTSPAGSAAPVRTPPAKATKATKPSRSTRRHRQPRRSHVHRRAKVHAAHGRAAHGPARVSPPNR